MSQRVRRWNKLGLYKCGRAECTTANFKVGGSIPQMARFAGLHVETDEALTLQNDVYSSRWVTLRSAGAFLQNSRTLTIMAAINLLGTAGAVAI